MKIDSEKPYNHNFYEDINIALSKADENLKRDSKLSFEDSLHVPSTNDENDSEDNSIYVEKTITEITCPDKEVVGENIMKDVWIDEGVKVSPNKNEENENMSTNIAEEVKDIALKAMQNQNLVPDEKEIVIGEISDEKIRSLKELFFSEDQKSADIDPNEVDENKSIIQSIEKQSHDTTMTTETNAGEQIKSSKADVSSKEITEKHHSSLPQLSGAEMSATEEMLIALVAPSEAPIERNVEAGNGLNFDGPKLALRKSCSQNCGEVSLPQMEPLDNNSARIAYSGSISIRSDSSTTSARSFAFPILQTEWSSSPVKMAKADRRRYRKHHGWRSSLFCCGF